MYQVSGDELRNMALCLPGRVVPRLFFWECYWETGKDRAWRQLLPPEARALSPSCPPRLRHHHALEPLDRWLVLHWASVCLPNGPQGVKGKAWGVWRCTCVAFLPSLSREFSTVITTHFQKGSCSLPWGSKLRLTSVLSFLTQPLLLN